MPEAAARCRGGGAQTLIVPSPKALVECKALVVPPLTTLLALPTKARILCLDSL